MKSILTQLFLLLSISSYTQLAKPDIIKTSNNELIIQPIIHGSIVLTWKKMTIYIDPYGGAERYMGLESPDIILITDIHGDHLNQNTLNEFDLNTTKFFVPQAVFDKLPAEMKKVSVVVGNGESREYYGVIIEAIPMYNLPEDETSRHPKGRGNGYILNLDGTRIYISGDTEDIPEMRTLQNINVAFVCMNLPFTMTIDQAASAVNIFKPSIVYPYHYRGREGLSDVETFKRMVLSENSEIDVRLRNWYPK